jgi:ArsR family transcriptional regulator
MAKHRNPMTTKYEQASSLFALLAHQPRLQILDELRRGEACVCHLQAVLGRPQAYVSQQLGVLREAGVVSDRRDGLFVYYGIADRHVEALLKQTLGPAGDATGVPGCPCPRCETEST